MSAARKFLSMVICSLIMLPGLAAAQENKKNELPDEAHKAVHHAFRPESREPTQERIDALELPEGFRIAVFARDLGHARMMAVDPGDGTVYLTNPNQDRVLAIRDTDGDGTGDQVRPVWEGLPMVHGIAIHEDRMYLAGPRVMWLAKRGENGFGRPQVIADDLPDGGQHPNRTMAVGQDGMLYLSVGSSCNACEETNPEHATMIRMDLDGGNRTIFATGLRNTVGFDWHPKTGDLWGMDMGSDARGDDIPPDELNRIEQGKSYGWPWLYGKNEIDPIMDDPDDASKEELAKKAEPAVSLYTAHSSPLNFVFYEAAMFPERYHNGAFVTFRGSWNRYPAVGYKVGFLPFDEQGIPGGMEDFVTGFLIEDGTAQFARLAGLAVAQDGSLLVADDSNGVVYRISFEKE
jgi:glucose/arabinose dehydrogenase